MDGDVPANMKEELGIVYSEAQRAAVIVKNLLTFCQKTCTCQTAKPGQHCGRGCAALTCSYETKG